MQTGITPPYKDTAIGQQADTILRSCVHCGFCSATCPTYQLLGDELDGPRGRIYLIKQVLEGEKPGRKTQLHLDRCLTCRSCETTCPSGVRYSELLDIGRSIVDRQVRRPFTQQLLRFLLRKLLPYRNRLGMLLNTARQLRPILPSGLQNKIPAHVRTDDVPGHVHSRKVLLFDGCVQSSATPEVNVAARRVLDRMGISALQILQAGCCGAVSHHLSAHDEALDFMRHNIDAWWPHIEAGVEAIITTASGCGLEIKEYGALLKHDPRYAGKAARISALSMDLCELLSVDDIAKLDLKPGKDKIAFHPPCTLQHGQQIHGRVEDLLIAAGITLTAFRDTHLCCGSAGTYSILQTKLSNQLLNNKVNAINSGKPDVIATANIGCQLHLASASQVPVVHWIEVINKQLPA